MVRLLAAMLAVFLVSVSAQARDDDDYDYVPEYSSRQPQNDYEAFYHALVPSSCCWTNRCCQPIEASELIQHGSPAPGARRRYTIKASGREIYAGPKRDDVTGRFHLCACNQLPGGGYESHNPAGTPYCLIEPELGS